MTSALEVTGLTYAHPGAGRPTIADVDLRVGAGAMTAVVGPSGSGKTTVLRLVAGLLAPDAGEIAVAGASVLDRPPERRGMTMMFQKPHLFPHLNVLDNVAFAARVAGRPRAQARESAQRYLSLVHLGDLGRRRTRELSGGQEQRVALARALAAEPEVLLLDEPFSALDAELRASMHELLGEVRAALGPTIVMVTHDMSEAALADRVAVLIQGRIAQDDALAELYLAPATIEVARVLGGFSEVPGALDAGRHHSALGALSCRSGQDLEQPGQSPVDGTVLLRQESVCVLPQADGPAPADRAGAARRPSMTSVAGDVCGISWAGARQIATVRVEGADNGTATVRGEVPLGRTVRVGDRVQLSIDPDAWCLAGPVARGLQSPAPERARVDPQPEPPREPASSP